MKDIRFIFGVDPGGAGSVSVWDNEENTVQCVKMPKDVSELIPFIESYKGRGKCLAFIEKLSVRPDDVRMGEGNHFGKLFRVQKLMANYEQLKAVFGMACNVPFVLCHPMTWQSRLKIRIRGEEYSDRKRRFKDIAGEYYPMIKPTLWNADSLLIMHFGRMAISKTQKWVMQNLPKKEASLFAL